MQKLIIGAGDRRIDGFKTHDIQDLPRIDYVCDLWDLPDYIEDGTLDEVHMTHVLEHFPMEDTLAVLQSIWQLMCDGGKLYIEVPNFKWHAQMILTNPSDRKIVEYAYGGQKNKWDFHYNGFTPEILTEDLQNAGFVIDELRPNSSIEVWCHR